MIDAGASRLTEIILPGCYIVNDLWSFGRDDWMPVKGNSTDWPVFL
jgi:hypothetical protein